MERLPDDHRVRRRGRHIAAITSVIPAIVTVAAAGAIVVAVVLVLVLAAIETSTITVTTARIMLVATVVSMWALSAMAVTVRHGRSRMARWAQQQHNDMQLPGRTLSTPVASAINPVDGGGHLHDPGGGGQSSRPSLVPSGGGQVHQNREKANTLLRIVESQQQLGDNCNAGTDLNMGEGVVDRYAQVLKPQFLEC